MPVSSSIHWKPLRDPHYVLASLERGQGGRRQLFIKQAVLVRVQALARGAYGQRAAGLLIGRRYECPITGTSYVLIESLVEAQPAPDEASLANTIRALAAQFHGHDSLERVGWFCSEPTVDDRLARTPAAIHLASFPEPWQTVLVVNDRGTGGVFFLRDATAARWFPSPFYEQIEPTRNHQPTKPTSVSWPEYLTMDAVVPLAPPQPIVPVAPRQPLARSAPATATPVSPSGARSPSQRVASTGSLRRSLRIFVSRIVSLSKSAWRVLANAFARLRPHIAHGSSAVGESLMSFRKTTADRGSTLARGSVVLLVQAKEASTKVVEREIARRAEAARARQVEAEAQRVRQEAERERQEEAERTRRAVAEAERVRQEAERARRAEAERARRAEVERERRAEAERVRQLQAERAREAEAEQARRAEAERVARLEAERVRQEAAARARQAEAERMRQAEAERAQKAEAERARRAEAERVRQIELERARKAEEERARKAEEERAQLAAIGRAQLAEEERARLARAERARVAEIERARVAAEAERARVAEAERARVAEIERAQVAAEAERARVAAEAERARRAAAEQSSRKKPLPIPEPPRSRGSTGPRPVTSRLTDKQMALAATVTATQLADLEDTTHMDRPYRYLALAAREGFVVVTKSDGGDSDRSEFWVLEEPDAHILLTVVTSDRWVREATIHYNVHTEDDSLLQGTPPEHRDLESGTIYVCESAVDQLRGRCRRLRASGRLVREWKVAPPIDLPLPFRAADGATVPKPAPDGPHAHPASRSSQA